MKQAKLIQYILGAIWGVLLLVEVLALFSVWQLDMIPGKYFALLTAILAVLWLGIGALLFWKSSRSGSLAVRRWIASILIVLTVAACAVGVSAVTELRRTLQNVTGARPTGMTVAVYVRKDDPAQNLQAAAQYTFSYVQGYEEDRTEQVLQSLEKALGQQPKATQYPSVFEMLDGLYEKQTDAVILNSAYVHVLQSVEQYADFADRTRVLYEVAVEDLPAASTPGQDDPSTTETKPPVEKNITNTPFVLYISGSDTRAYNLTTSLSDVNILVAVNPNTKEILLLNTPRDYYVPNPAGGGKLDKLTHCGMYGINCSIQALSDLYDIHVDYYAHINFTGFKKLIDAIGGVTVNSDATFYAGGEDGTEYLIKKGSNYLDGVKALAFARERYNVAGGDNGRGKNQMKVITAVIDKMTTSPALITNYSAIMQSLQGLFATDMSTDEISSLVKMQLDDMAQWHVMSYAVAGDYGKDVTYSMPGWKLSVTYINQTLVDQGASLIQRVLAGETLTEQDLKYPE